MRDIRANWNKAWGFDRYIELQNVTFLDLSKPKEKWEPTYGSPGNLSCIEHYVFSGQGMGISTCKIMSLNTKQNRITCAIVDAELKLAELIQFDDDERCTQLESILVQNQVREAISCGQLKPNASKALERTGVTCSALKSAQFEVPTHDRQNAIFAKGSTDTEEHYAMCVNAACHYLKLSDKPNYLLFSTNKTIFVIFVSSFCKLGRKCLLSVTIKES